MNGEKIKITDLEVYAYHGVLQEEKESGQLFYLDICLEVWPENYQEACRKDLLEKTVNYAEVCHFVTKVFKEKKHDLIEAATYATVEKTLLAFPAIKSMFLEVKKPQAPIGLPFGNVSVCVERGWKRAYIALGSNMGDSKAILKEAIQDFEANDRIRVKKVSDFIETLPYGNVEQDNFLNGAMAIETLYDPHELLEQLQKIEYRHGRVREIHWGPRTLDLDILFYEGVCMWESSLTIPHSDMQNRDFVLIPMMELNPYVIHEPLGKSVKQMYMELMEKKDEESKKQFP